MVYAQHNICPGEWHTQTPLGFWHTNGSPNLGQTTRPYIKNEKKKRTCKIVDFAIPADHKVKLKESEKKKKDKYLDLMRELKKLWDVKVMFIPIIIGALGTVTKNKRMSGDHLKYCIIEISQNTEKSPGDLRRLAVTQSPVKDPSANTDVKTLKE